MNDIKLVGYLINCMNDMLERTMCKAPKLEEEKNVLFLVPNKAWQVLNSRFKTNEKENILEESRTVLGVLRPEFTNDLAITDHGFLMGIPVLCTKYTKNIVCINTKSGISEVFDFESEFDNLLEMDKNNG